MARGTRARVAPRGCRLRHGGTRRRTHSRHDSPPHHTRPLTFLAPIFFAAGLGVAAFALALHFIVTRQPTSSVFPTVRFVPIDTVRVLTVARPRDLRVLMVRCLTAILIGAALARPVLTPERRVVARVIMADVSSAVRTISDVRDTVRALLRPGDVLVPFDTGARAIRRGAVDSMSHLSRTPRDGHLSPALIAALRAASAMRGEADSVELVIVSPLLAGEIDGATAAIRALWPGRIRLSRVAADSSPTPHAGLAIEGTQDDPLAVAAVAAGIALNDSAVRVLRGAATASDSAWATRGRRTLVRWPIHDAPPGWVARRVADTVGAVVAGETALVFPFERRWTPDSATRETRVVARWVDGQPAAVERRVGTGCIRDVAIPIPASGDLVLRPAFGRFLKAIGAPCHTVARESRLDDAQTAALVGSGRLAASHAIPAPDLVATPLVPWLLGAALLVALLEVFIR